MSPRETVSLRPGEDADFALRITNDECEPYLHRGDTALIKHVREVRDGDVGLFFDGERAVIRQYCEDWAGNAYLFVLNRRHKQLDRMFPAGEGRPVCCFGIVQGLGDVPLPEC